MTMQNGGPAFPCKDAGIVFSGMTLRDWFAGQALAGFLASYSGENVTLPRTADAAERAYDYADAMLRERAAP
jgi:hypothetical protein